MTRRLFIVAFVVLVLGSFAHSQTTAFTYQGNLSVAGAPANGNFDFQFSLFSDASGGSPIGLGIAVNKVTVTDGSFTVLLNFQNQFPGANRFLEIRVRPAGQGTHTLLTPRQFVSSSPYSIKSVNSEQLGGVLASQYVLTGDPRLSDPRNPLPNSVSYIQNRTTEQVASNFNISGNGTIAGVLNVKENSTFQKALSVGTGLAVTGPTTLGGGLTVNSISTIGGSLAVSSNVNVSGSISAGTSFNIAGNFLINRSRLDLFNADATPRGFTFEVLNNPEFLVVRNDLGSTLMTIAPDVKVGIGDNNPTEATLEIGGTIAVSGLGGANGEHLCRSGNLIRACSVALAEGATVAADPHQKKIAELEAAIRQQQAEFERYRNEFASLKEFICSQNRAATVCAPKK